MQWQGFSFIAFCVLVVLSDQKVSAADLPTLSDLPPNVNCQLCRGLAELVVAGEEGKYNRQYIEEAGVRLCGFLGSYKQECLKFVNVHMDDIINAVDKVGEAAACKEIKLCDAIDPHPGMNDDDKEALLSNLNAETVEEDPVNDVECALCEAMAKLIKQLASEGGTPEMVIAALRQTCKFMGGFEKECSLFIDNYARKLIDIIFEIGDTGACVKLGVCAKKMSTGGDLASVIQPSVIQRSQPCNNCLASVNSVVASMKTEITANTICFQLFKITNSLCPIYMGQLLNSFNDLLTTFAAQTFCINKFACSPAEVKAPIFGCVRCASMVAAFKSAAITFTGQAVMTTSFESICNQSVLNDTLDCKVFGKILGNRVIPDTFNELDTVTTCNLLNACGMNNLFTMPEPTGNSTACSWCESFATNTFMVLELTFSDQHIQNFTNLVCNFDKNTEHQHVCESKLMKTITYARNDVLRILAEGRICKLLHICTPAEKPDFSALSKTAFDLCKSGEIVVKDLVTSDHFNEAIISYAKFRCLGVFPFYHQCEKIFKNVAWTVQHIFSNINSTNSLCNKLFNDGNADILTNDFDKALISKDSPLRKKKISDSVTCEGVLNIILTFLEHFRVAKDTLGLLKVSCSLIPNEHQASWCQKAIQPMLDSFLKSVVTNFRSNKICL